MKRMLLHNVYSYFLGCGLLLICLGCSSAHSSSDPGIKPESICLLIDFFNFSDDKKDLKVEDSDRSLIIFGKSLLNLPDVRVVRFGYYAFVMPPQSNMDNSDRRIGYSLIVDTRGHRYVVLKALKS